MWRVLKYFDEHGNKIKHLQVERKEQILADTYVEAGDCVLELGARYGTVSCATNIKLSNKRSHVVVEPDERVWKALEENRDMNLCEFHIVKGFVSRKKMELVDLDDWKGYGAKSKEVETSAIPSYSLEEICEKYGIEKFNVLIADCEGFLEKFLDENPGFLDGLRLIIFEKDNPKECNYRKIKKMLKEKGMVQKVAWFREAWVKE